MTVVAISISGQEFLYNYNTAHHVAKTSAATICAALNNSGYQLQPGEVWHIYSDISPEWDRAGIMAGGQSFKLYRGTLRRVARGPFIRH